MSITSNNRPYRQDFDLLSSNTDRSEELSLDLQQAQERLLALRRQMEEAERRERQLEELKTRREEVTAGQRQLIEKFTRALTLLERAEYEARREVEQIQMTRQGFTDQLHHLEEIHPAQWAPEDIQEQLTRAMSQIDSSRAVYSQSRARIDALSGHDIDQVEGENQSSLLEVPVDSTRVLDQNSFIEWLRRGLAFTLPLLVALGVLIFVLLKANH